MLLKKGRNMKKASLNKRIDSLSAELSTMDTMEFIAKNNHVFNDLFKDIETHKSKIGNPTLAYNIGSTVYALNSRLSQVKGGEIKYYLNSLKAALQSKASIKQDYVYDHMSNSGNMEEKEVITTPEIPSMLSCKISRFFEELKIKAKKFLGIKPKQEVKEHHATVPTKVKAKKGSSKERTTPDSPTPTPHQDHSHGRESKRSH